MRKAILVSIAAILFSGVANAGVVRYSVKATKVTVTKGAKVTKKVAKVAYKVAY